MEDNKYISLYIYTMKKVKFFYTNSNYSMLKLEAPDYEALQDEINEFLAKDKQEINVYEVDFRTEVTGTITSVIVMVYYEDIVG